MCDGTFAVNLNGKLIYNIWGENTPGHITQNYTFSSVNGGTSWTTENTNSITDVVVDSIYGQQTYHPNRGNTTFYSFMGTTAYSLSYGAPSTFSISGTVSGAVQAGVTVNLTGTSFRPQRRVTGHTTLRDYRQGVTRSRRARQDIHLVRQV